MDFGSRYRAETEELYPYAGPAQRFLDQVIQGTASLAPTVVGNLLLPGSGPYFQMLQSVGGAMAEAKKRGADDSTALAYGAAVGIADTMLEKLVDGMGGVFGKGFLEQMIGDNVRQVAGSSGVREALIYLGGMAGEGFEEFLSVFANELLDVHMLGATARTWEALLEDAGLSFFASALVSGLVQGASRLGALVDSGADDLTVADLGRQLADDVEAELRGAQGEALASDSLTVDLPESAAGAEEAGIPSPDMDNSSGIAYNKHTQVIKNSLQGKAYENKMYPQFEAEYYFTERQITIVMPSGTRIRVDAIGLDVDGNVVIMEYKSSATAKLTNNQTLAFEEFRNSGGYVVGKGKNFFYGGTDIPPMSAGTKIFIQRPGQKESW